MGDKLLAEDPSWSGCWLPAHRAKGQRSLSCSMTSKLEQKEIPQANGAVVPGDCLAGPEPSEFLGSASPGVEVVVLESRANAKGVREEDALLENGSQSNESDDTSTERGPEPASPLKETSFSIGLQVLFPFLLAGFGTVAAGMVLDIVQVGLELPWAGLCVLALHIGALWGKGVPGLVQQQGGVRKQFPGEGEMGSPPSPCPQPGCVN